MCGFVFERYVKDVVIRGFSCPCCGIKISYPNRFVSEVLIHADIDFEREKSFEWSCGKRYDFYIKPDTIIEVHGSQHYEKAFSFGELKLEEVQKNDELKRKIALENGIVNYYIINAKKSDDLWLKNNIIDELSSVIDLQNIDWERISSQASKNLTKLCLEYWNDGLKVSAISQKIGIDSATIRNKLKYLTELGKCNYDSLEELRETQRIISNNNKKKVCCITTNKHFDSVNEAAAFYGISPKALSNCLNGWSNSTYYKEENRYLNWRYD